jgi:hypothetical protein
MSRAALISMTLSAIICWIIWNSPIGCRTVCAHTA